MAYIWFNAVLASLGKKVNFESISNIYGNSFAKDSAKIVQAANPLISHKASGNAAQTLLAMPGQIAIIEGDNQKEQAKQKMGDISWFEDFLK